MIGSHQSRPTDACATYRPLLPLLAHRMLEPAEAMEVEAHTAHCAECRAALRLDDALDIALRRNAASAEQRAPMSRAAIARLLVQGDARPRPPFSLNVQAWPVAAIVSFIALLALFVASVGPVGRAFLGPNGMPPSHLPPSQIQIAATAAAQQEATLLSRPLHLPAVAPGAACPISPWRQTTVMVSTATLQTAGPVAGVGTGPLYLQAVASPLHLGRFPLSPAVNTSLGMIWPHITLNVWIAPGVADTFYARGQQLDGANQMRFSDGILSTITAPFFSSSATTVGPDAAWALAPAVMFVAGPGCYAMQIDGASFSEVIVFQIK
jgi:hypothetical protein